jgi:hypothetical protein
MLSGLPPHSGSAEAERYFTVAKESSLRRRLSHRLQVAAANVTAGNGIAFSTAQIRDL